MSPHVYRSIALAAAAVSCAFVAPSVAAAAPFALPSIAVPFAPIVPKLPTAPALPVAPVAPIATPAVDAPLGLVLTSTCSVGQLDRAAHFYAPDESAFLDSMPPVKAVVTTILSTPVEGRRVARDRIVASNPALLRPSILLMGMPRSLEQDKSLVEIAENCSKF